MNPALTYLLLSGLLVLQTAAARSQVDLTAATDGAANIQSTALQPISRSAGTQFKSLKASETGVDFVSALKAEHHKNYLENGSGVAIGDIDGDGRPDLYLTSIDAPNKLFRQLDDFKFADVTVEAGVGGKATWSSGATFADVDNDGDLDLFVCNLDSPNQLFINQGDGRFKENAAAAGVDFSGASYSAAFADYDRDGDLDYYLVTYRVLDVAQETQGQVKIRLVDDVPTVHPDFEEDYAILQGYFVQVGRRDHLYRNNGDGTFTEVSEAAGIVGNDLGLSATWWDYNNDLWPDIYVANDLKTPDHLFRNNGDGTFTDVLPDTVNHSSWFSMGADSGDINNDGLVDLMVGDMSAVTHAKEKTTMGAMGRNAWFLASGTPRQYMRNSVFLNTATDRFMEVSYLTGLDSTNWTWSVKLADLDNDGWNDLFVTTGASRNVNDSDTEVMINSMKAGSPEMRTRVGELLLQLQALDEPNMAFRNNGDFEFEEVGEAWGLDRGGVSHGAAFADLDGDGDLDIVVNNLKAQASVYRNDSSSGNRVIIELRGQQSNYFGVGAVVRLKTNGVDGEQVRQLIPVRGYLASNEPIIHFGLGQASDISELTVEWPSGQTQKFTDLEANRRYTISEPPADSIADLNPGSATEPIFSQYEEASGLIFRHTEVDFDDFEREPLLPYKLSQLGPGLAWADVNGDGRDDLFVTGAAKQSGMLFINTANGHFVKQPGPWKDDADAEDMAPLFFDIDGDGDQDLYLASGSNEFSPGQAVLQDRLYLNDGAGKYVKAPQDRLPADLDSGSSIAAADFDRDGDLDLFVGSRVVPGLYPTTPVSRLYINHGGFFKPADPKQAPGLAEVGLVNSAIWTDVDDDGWVDLLLALDWGSVTLFANNKGQLSDRTEAAGLSLHQGWWNGLAAGDVDNDGDMDYVATNVGYNTKYHASDAQPLRLYYSDFDNNGRLDLVESDYEGDIEYPIRGRSCSAAAMPFINEQFATYQAFSVASMDEIFGQDNLSTAPSRSANYLASSLLINDGSGQFEVRALPRLAQASPGYAAALFDFDSDGAIDLLINQNFFGPQVETGRMDGGLGLLMRGDGRGNFTAVDARHSGIIIPGDATALAISDIDGDNRVDLAIAMNNEPLRIYQNRDSQAGISVRLHGQKANPTAVGARITLVFKNGSKQVAEVMAGSSYLSQSSATLHFGMGDRIALRHIEVRWPDGLRSIHTENLQQATLVIAHPG